MFQIFPLNMEELFFSLFRMGENLQETKTFLDARVKNPETFLRLPPPPSLSHFLLSASPHFDPTPTPPTSVSPPDVLFAIGLLYTVAQPKNIRGNACIVTEAQNTQRNLFLLFPRAKNRKSASGYDTQESKKSKKGFFCQLVFYFWSWFGGSGNKGRCLRPPRRDRLRTLTGWTWGPRSRSPRRALRPPKEVWAEIIQFVLCETIFEVPPK